MVLNDANGIVFRTFTEFAVTDYANGGASSTAITVTRNGANIPGGSVDHEMPAMLSPIAYSAWTSFSASNRRA